jgi:hypothetical protein
MVKDYEVFDSCSFRKIQSGVSGSPIFLNVTYHHQALNFLWSFGLLNDVFLFYTVLDTGCPIFYLKLADVLYYVVFQSLFGPSFGSYG